MKKFHELTPEERYILCEKGTEMPGSYEEQIGEGIYVCRQCDAPLYMSSDQFESGCGWPSFDDAIPGAIDFQLDADGYRTEALCNNCQGHLGHRFDGEEATPKNTRHCINSLALRFLPGLTKEGYERALFAAGCFWGIQEAFEKVSGVVRTTVGYTGGYTVDPTYKEVCTNQTGHAEAVEVIFDPEKTTYESLLRAFLAMHTPTQPLHSQYRSAVFYLTKEQKEAAEKLLDGLPVEISPSKPFYKAEKEHQHYYRKI